MSISGGTGEPQQVFGEIVSGNYFTVLGARPLIGRGFLPDEDAKPGEKLVCVLGYGEWQKRFGGDPSIVGRDDQLNGRKFTVVGVMPNGFKGTNAIGAPALWVPYMTYREMTAGVLLELIRPESRRGLVLNVTGRLKPGVIGAAGRGEPEDDRAPARGRIPEREQGPQRHASCRWRRRRSIRASATTS